MSPVSATAAPGAASPLSGTADLMSLVKASGGARIASLIQATAITQSLLTPTQTSTGSLATLLGSAFLYQLSGSGNSALLRTYQPGVTGGNVNATA